MEFATTKAQKITIKGSLSERIWDLTWPSNLTAFDEFLFEKSNYKELVDFLSLHKEEMLTTNEIETDFLFNSGSEAKARFYQTEADIFKFTLEGKIIGVFIGNSLDWLSYYFRYVNVLPQYRGSKLCERASLYLINQLQAHGVKKIDLDVSPSNLNQVSRLTKIGFNITGNHLSEVWGACIKLTYFMDQNHKEKFITKYCLGLRPQLDT